MFPTLPGDNWQCLGKLRFESANQIGHFETSIDPTARFLFVIDYETSRLYCLEIGNIAGVPSFSSCTQVTFGGCGPLVALVPYDLVDVSGENGREKEKR